MKWNTGNFPEVAGDYVVTIDGVYGRCVCVDSWNGHSWRYSKIVIAWAEWPEPYEPPRVVRLDIEDVIHKPKMNL